MAKRPEFKRVGAFIYACPVCSNFKVEIVKPRHRAELFVSSLN